ncbi:MAG: hypothetical protein WEC33_05580, partial [Dehalococcoidia bacterium]
PGLRLPPNWTTAAAALEGILAYLGQPLPRHAVMGLTGHAFHLAVASRPGVHVLPDGPVALDWSAMVRNYSRTGSQWERFGGAIAPEDDPAPAREAAIAWSAPHLDAGRPLIGWDFHLHEFAIVYGHDRARQGFLVHSLSSPDLGPLAPWDEWPSTLGLVELFAPIAPVEVDPDEAVAGALATAVAMLNGEPLSPAPRSRIGAGQPLERTVVSGAAAFDAWADYFQGDDEVDRAGNAYTLAVLQAARTDAISFIDDLAIALPDLAGPLGQARGAFSELTRALAPLITLFPFPAGGHGNVANPGLRRAAAMVLRRAAGIERRAGEALSEAARLMG